MLFCHIFNEFLAVGSAAFVESRIDGVFVRVDNLRAEHAEQQRLSVAFCDAETSQQFWCNLSALFKCCSYECGVLCRRAIDAGESVVPVNCLVRPVSVAVPSVSSPCGEPHPVSVQLLQTVCRVVVDAVGGIGPVPVGGLGIEVQRICVMGVMHCVHCLLYEIGR